MTPRRRMSEDEAIFCFMLIFPPLWPLLLAHLIVRLVECIGNGIRVLWHRVKLRFRSKAND